MKSLFYRVRDVKDFSEITPEELATIKVITFDIDGVITPGGTMIRENEDGSEFSMKTHQLSSSFIENIKKLKQHVRVAFSSGRSFLYLRSLTNAFFDDTIILQAENGNITWIDGVLTHASHGNAYYTAMARIREGINGLRGREGERLRGFEPKMFILTVHSEPIDDIPRIVAEHDIEQSLYCLRTHEAYDIGKKGVNKGSGISYIAQYLGIPEKHILTTGNHLNDTEMLEIGLGVTVAPDIVSAPYKIDPQENELGGEKLADFLVRHFTAR